MARRSAIAGQREFAPIQGKLNASALDLLRMLLAI
jgi:hypothetical protein